MELLYSPEYRWIWPVALAAVLFVPVRQLIWVLAVRRAERRAGAPTEEDQRQALRRRASVTAALLCAVFSLLYANTVFVGPTP